ncbi:MAG: T9SS type A sorting domain-containing protein, partial [Bacteroidota bacterium]
GNDNYSTIYCDATAWLGGKYIDYLAPQLYWKIGGSQDYTKLLPWWNSVSNGRQIIPGLAAYRIGTSSFGPAGEIGNQIRFERTNTPIPGNFLYTTNNITGNLGGITDSLKNDLYKYHALVPRMNWKDTLPPNPPLNVHYGRNGSSPIATIRWDVPSKASDMDTASMYVIYQLANASVSQNDIDDARNITSVTNQMSFNPLHTAKKEINFAVTALDKNNNESPASGVVTLNTLPAVPLLADPSDGTNDLLSSVPLKWNYAEGAGAYTLQLAADSSFSSIIATTNLLYDTVWTASNLEGQHDYYWKVKGSNFVGEGTYSIPWKFFVGTPSTPLLASPGNYLTNVDYDTLQFSWNKSTAGESYHLQISTTSDFSTTVVDTLNYNDTSYVLTNLKAYTVYNWRVNSTNGIGTSLWSTVFRFRTKNVTSVFDFAQTAQTFELRQNYPNPFNPETKIRFSIVESNYSILKVYDMLGSEVATLVNEELPAGTYTVSFNGGNLATGVYIYRLLSGKYAETKKMILQK